MTIQERLLEDMKTAMKASNKVRLETIRGLRAQLKNREIDLGRPLTEDDVIQVLMNAAKKRKESIEQFLAVNRHDRAEIEKKELEIIQEYLPEQMSEAEIANLADEIIKTVKAQSMKDMGKVMGQIMPKVKGRADGRLVQQIVTKKLSSL